MDDKNYDFKTITKGIELSSSLVSILSKSSNRPYADNVARVHHIFETIRDNPEIVEFICDITDKGKNGASCLEGIYKDFDFAMATSIAARQHV